MAILKQDKAGSVPVSTASFYKWHFTNPNGMTDDFNKIAVTKVEV